MRQEFRSALGRLHRKALRAALRRFAHRDPGTIRPGEIRRILVSGSMGIGNAVMLEPLLHTLRESFPRAHLAAAVRAAAPSRGFLEWAGLVDELVIIRGTSRLDLLSDALRLARGRWDLYVVRFNGASYEIIVSAVLGRVPYRLGHVTSGRFSSEVDWLFNLPVTMSDYDHEVDRYLGLAECLGLTPSRRAPMLRLSSADRSAAECILREACGASRCSPVIGLQPGTSNHQSWKRWPVEYWKVLAAELVQKGFLVLGLGSSEERELVDEICRNTGARNLAGMCTLPQAAAVVERCSLLVCSDSGLMHVAAAVGTRIIGIFGPTDRTRTRPYGDKHILVLPTHCRSHVEPCLSIEGQLQPACTWRACLQSIQPRDVLGAVLRQFPDPAVSRV